MKYKNAKLKPVEKIELNEKNIKIRIILFIISFCVIIASAVGIIIGFNKKDSGWSEINVNPVSEYSCADDFVLYYNLGLNELDSKTEEKLISVEYTKALEYSYKLLNKYKEYQDIKNLYYINNHPNEEIEVDEYLYDSLKMVSSSSNIIYTSPIVDMYEALFSASTDLDASKLNPKINENLKELYLKICSFINDKENVELRFLGNNKIYLYVSDEYDSFLKENEIVGYIDFSFFKNAVIIDYVAKQLSSQNYTYGYISSYDGYSINLNDSGNYPFEQTVLAQSNTSYTEAASIDFVGSISVVQYRSFLYFENDSVRMRKLNGEVFSLYFDENDGINKYSKDMITFYSKNLSCLEITLATYKQFIKNTYSDAFYDEIDFIYVENYDIKYSDSNIKFNKINYGYRGVCLNV